MTYAAHRLVFLGFLVLPTLMLAQCEPCPTAAEDEIVLTGRITKIENDGWYVLDQALTGYLSSTSCPSCNYIFDINYEALEWSNTCNWCNGVLDGTYTIAFKREYSESTDEWGSLYSIGDNSFYPWYFAKLNTSGHSLVFNAWYYDAEDNFGWQAYGYWDLQPEADKDLDGFSLPMDNDDCDPDVPTSS